MDKQLTFRNMLTGQSVTAEHWQAELKQGDFIITRPALGLLSNPVAIALEEQLPTIYTQLLKPMKQKGFFNCKSFSEWEPHGETGIVCIADAAKKITEEEFKQARARGWKKPAQ